MSAKNKKVKIVYLINTPYNVRDHKRFGIDILRNKGVSVEIWDCTEIAHKKNDITPPDKYIDINHVYFDTKQGVRSRLEHFRDEILVIAMLNYSIWSSSIYKTMNKYKIPYVQLSLGSIPIPKFSYLSKLRADKFSYLLKVLHSLVVRLYNQYKPEILLTSSGLSGSARNQKYISRYKTIITSHCLDYDLYLEGNTSKLPPTLNTPFAVFLDVGAAEYFHQDLKILRTKKFIDKETYFFDLNRFFDYFEQKYALRIVIACHPRVNYSKNYYGGRKIIRGETQALVKNSKVVLNHFSTAINFAILYQKPIVFIKFSEKFRYCIDKFFPENFAQLLNCDGIVEMGKESSFDCLPDDIFRTDYLSYKRYKTKYIKQEGTPMKNNWEIFYDYISNEYVIGD